MTIENFRTRAAMIESKHEDFLKLLVSLGGYCTVAQADELRLAETGKRTRRHLRRLEHLGFLRRVAAYPVVYQVTKSTTRHLERDCGARRRHTLATVQSRLLAVDFYLAARKWPARFILDHEQKIAAFVDNGCPESALPQYGGRPYLREQFVLWLSSRRLGVGTVDEPHRAVLSQMLGLIRRFGPTVPYLGEGILELLIATGCERRYYRYRRLLEDPRVLATWPGDFEFEVRPYRVLRPTQPVAALLCPRCNRPTTQADTPRDHAQERSNPSRRATRLLPLNQKQPNDPTISIHCDLVE
jgi:hypothetical protein